MSTKFVIDAHQYHSAHTQSLHTLFFRDNDEITLAEFYAAFFLRLRGVPSFDLNRCVFPRISAEEWEALGISPSRAREEGKQADAEHAKQFPGSFT